MDNDTKAYIEKRLDRTDAKIDAVNKHVTEILVQVTQLNGTVTGHSKQLAHLPCESHWGQFLMLSKQVSELVGAERVTGQRDTEERQVVRAAQKFTQSWVWELAKIVLPLTPWIGFAIYLAKSGSAPMP